MWNKQKVEYNFLLLAISLVVQATSSSTDSCYPNGVKLGLGDNWDKSKNYDSALLSASKNHDYSISYFVSKECVENYIILEQDGRKFKIAHNSIDFYDFQITENNQTNELKVYIQTFLLDVKDFRLKENSPIEYSLYYLNDANTQEKRGPFTFIHHGEEKLKKKGFSLMWIADFDVNPNANNVYYGRDNFYSMLSLYQQKKSSIVSIIGGGDYAYDLHSNFGSTGLDFMRVTESLFSSVPFLPIAGNHESNYPIRDFKYFNAYYRTPHYLASKNERYTAQFGRLLMIGINTNYYNKFSSTKNGQHTKTIVYMKDKMDEHIKWMRQTLHDLKGTYDWVVVYSHQNMFCSDKSSVECVDNPVQFQSFQDLFIEYKIDVYIGGHVHGYERVHPIYKDKQRFTENDKCTLKQCSFYDKPTAPVYIVDGTGGTPYSYVGIPSPFPNPSKYSAFSDQTTGFSMFTVTEDNQLLFEHYRSQNMEVVDKFIIQKEFNLEEHDFDGHDDSMGINKGLLAGLIVLSILLLIAVLLVICYVRRTRLTVSFIKDTALNNETRSIRNIDTQL